MQRRDFGVGALSLVLAHRAIAAEPLDARRPLYLFSRRQARVFMLGFGGAKDESWASAEVRRAFAASSGLWLEVGHDAGPEPDAAAQRERLTHDPQGRSFFDVLEPDVRARVLEYCGRLGIARQRLEKQRPWSAFYTLNGAYWSQHRAAYEQSYPDETLMRWATEQKKPIRYETPNQLEFARFMAAMPDPAQSQYIAFLLDFFDDEAAGRNRGEFDWIRGDTRNAVRAVERMRTRAPDLYRIMQVRRNAWWAQKIDQLLTAGGTHFIGIGQMHTVGPDGIPTQLGPI